MWLWESELHRLRFRRKADRYWQCVRRFGLTGDDHLSLYSWSEQTVPQGTAARYLVELTEFHVTFLVGFDNIHFYFHERAENDWEPGGHTSFAELQHLGCDPPILRARADLIAAAFISALRGSLLPRTG